ncbi:hypothetical protein HWV62_23248 [Athelia sp. TMB]|nr:hypothetical protein HWV62_23248 [Athelia sp. TMB]
MGVLQYIYGPAKSSPDHHKQIDTVKAEGAESPVAAGPEPTSHSVASDGHSAPTNHVAALPSPTTATSIEATKADVASTAPPKAERGFSFRALAFLSNRPEVKPALSTVQDTSSSSATDGLNKRQKKLSSSDKQAQASALVVRTLIVGPLTAPSSSPSGQIAFAKLDLNKVKAQLVDPKTARKLIAQLRALPTSGSDESRPAGPIHAVCLDTTDIEADEKHFSRLVQTQGEYNRLAAVEIPSVATASIAKITSMFKDMHIVNLVGTPDFGLGQPGDGSGILSGAVPTAETVINGIQMLTPQLMALGYATGKAVLPDHTGVYPPTDRMSVLTYWWGLELVLPEASMKYLGQTESITHTIINFLTVLSALDSGVREILPFVRYIGQYVDFEFGSIQKQDKGRGVVCAATWIMPTAMVPRPWDFADPPPKPAPAPAASTDPAAPVSGLPRPSQTTEASSRPSEALSDASSPMTPVASLPPVLPEVVVSSPNGTSTSNLLGM